MTLWLAVGVVVVSREPPALGPNWWYSPKVILATCVWLIFAIVMNVKHTSLFRGARAAWLSIAGLVLLIATFGIVTAISRHDTSVQSSHADVMEVP